MQRVGDDFHVMRHMPSFCLVSSAVCNCSIVENRVIDVFIKVQLGVSCSAGCPLYHQPRGWLARSHFHPTSFRQPPGRYRLSSSCNQNVEQSSTAKNHLQITHFQYYSLLFSKSFEQYYPEPSKIDRRAEIRISLIVFLLISVAFGSL
jgi:hypothetical protein